MASLKEQFKEMVVATIRPRDVEAYKVWRLTSTTPRP